MVKINDELLMQVNGAAAGALALAQLGAGKQFNDAFVVGTIPSPMLHHGGVMAGGIAALNVLSAKADYKTRKNTLKTNGAAWLACTAVTLYNVNNKGQKRDASIGLAAATGILGTLNLVAGFQDDLP